jgi:hypothetical protein
VSRAFPSWKRSILTEIYLCHACSYQGIEDGNARTDRQALRVRRTATLHEVAAAAAAALQPKGLDVSQHGIRRMQARGDGVAWRPVGDALPREVTVGVVFGEELGLIEAAARSGQPPPVCALHVDRVAETPARAVAGGGGGNDGCLVLYKRLVEEAVDGADCRWVLVDVGQRVMRPGATVQECRRCYQRLVPEDTSHLSSSQDLQEVDCA